MLVPTLPEARYLILDDADAPSTVAAVLASERWGGRGPAPVLVPAWWRADADACMPLVHGAVARHAAVLGLRTLAEELVVEPGEAPGGAGVVSQLLLAAVQMADPTPSRPMPHAAGAASRPFPRVWSPRLAG
jgi:hypothetical protein